MLDMLPTTPKSVQLLAEAEVTTLQSNVKGEVWISMKSMDCQSGFVVCWRLWNRGYTDDIESVFFSDSTSLMQWSKIMCCILLVCFLLKEPTLHPWNFAWFNTSSEKMHHRWSVYSSSSAFSCKEADRLRASHNRLPCDPSLAHARNDDFSWKLCSIFIGQRREFQATQWISMQYNNTQFESFRSLCLRQQCLFSNSPLATCRFTPTPPFSYLPLQVTMAARLQAPRPCEDPQSNIDEVQRFVLSQKRWSDKEDQQMDFENIARNVKSIQLEQFFETPVQWMLHWHQDLESRTTSDSTVTACDQRTYIISTAYDSSPWFTSLSTSDISTWLYISCSSFFYVCHIIYNIYALSNLMFWASEHRGHATGGSSDRTTGIRAAGPVTWQDVEHGDGVPYSATFTKQWWRM